MPEAKRRIRVLHLEDNARDADLVRRRLDAGGFDCELVRAEGKAEYERALASGPFELVLCDYNVPGYDGLAALKRAREKHPDVPFIMLSGELSEEEAVECLRAGATDYLLKHRLQRLCPAVVRALAEAEERRGRTQAEIARRESDERFRSVVEAMAEGLVALDRDGKIVASNPAAARILGLTEKELIGRRSTDPTWRAVREDGAPFPSEMHPSVVTARTGEPQTDVVMGVHRPDGELRWMSMNSRPLQGGTDRTPYGVVTTFHDVTGRKRAEQALRESEMRFRGILDAAPDAVIISDASGRIVLANPAAERVFGYTPDAFAAMSIEGLVPEASSERHARLRAAYLQNPTARQMAGARPLEGRRADGTPVPLEISLSPLPTESGMLVVSVARDVTERMQMEQRLRHSQKMEAVGQLTGGVAHDFNNLLGVILGNLDLLERELADNAPAIKRVSIAQKAAARGADLTRRLLAFSRRQQLHAAAVPVAECVDSVLEMAGRIIGADIEIVKKFAEELPPVLADAASLESVLLNLMINSRDAMPRGGVITVAARLADLEERYPGVRAGEVKPGRYMCITVTDTGQGMPPEVLQRVFEPFFTTKERGKGTGLGLAMVYGFAKQSGGHVTVYSEVGRGTTVKLYLPPAVAGAAVAEAPKAASGEGLFEATALVVDDEVDLLEVAVAYLEEMGFRVLHAMDGPAALEVLAREPAVDLLVTDIVMPGGMTGAELARRVREARPGIRVVYSTGFASVALSEKNDTAVDGPVLNKPYRRAEFFAAIQRAMASRPEASNTGAEATGGGTGS